MKMVRVRLGKEKECEGMLPRVPWRWGGGPDAPEQFWQRTNGSFTRETAHIRRALCTNAVVSRIANNLRLVSQWRSQHF